MRLPIVQYGDPVLRAKGNPIEKIDDRIRELAQNMVETMHASNGVGLAAQQIGEPVQLAVVDVSQVEDRPSTMKLNGQEIDPATAMPLILINPQVELGNETDSGTEGCLSFPEITGEIPRSKSIVVHAQDLEGNAVKIETIGFLAQGYSARSRSLERRFVHRSNELGGEDHPVEQTQAAAKRDPARVKTSATRGGGNNALILECGVSHRFLPRRIAAKSGVGTRRTPKRTRQSAL